MYVFDTDHLSLYGRNLPALVMRVNALNRPLITTVINVEEQVQGRLKQLSEAKNDSIRSQSYEWLTETIRF